MLQFKVVRIITNYWFNNHQIPNDINKLILAYLTKEGDDKLIYQFPKTINIPPESIEFDQTYNSDGKDLKIEKYLYSKYETEIKSFEDFQNDIIFRFVTGYGHICDFEKRLQETDRLFCDYLIWRKNSNFEGIFNGIEMNDILLDEYIKICYIYGQNKYGHPIYYVDGLKYRSAMEMYKNCGEKGTDQVLAYHLRLLQQMKLATNKYYGLQTKKYKIGIIRHVLVFDLKDLNAIKVLTDMKIKGNYMKRFSGLFCQYYMRIFPEMLHRAYIINAPWGFQKVWKLFKKGLHPNTVRKIVILGKKYKKELFKEIDPNMVPTKYGGIGSWNIVQGSIPKHYPIEF